MVKPTKEIRNLLHNVHANAYSLSLWSFLVKEVDMNLALVYLDQIRSDAVQSFKLALQGYKKATYLAIRGMLEDTLCYIYYYHHPIEFKLFKTNPEDYMNTKELMQYLLDHPIIGNKVKKAGVYERLHNTYRNTSSLIHGTLPSQMELTKAIDEIRFDLDNYRSYVALFDKVTADVNFILGTFHLDYLNKWDSGYQNAIYDTMSDKYKNVMWE